MFKTLVPTLFLLLPIGVFASPIATGVPSADLRGAATFRYLGVPLYEARLYTQGGAPLDWSSDFAIELRFLRDLKRFDLVEGTMREFDRLGSPLPIRDQLDGCFSDVVKGDRFVAVSQGADAVGFWRNDRAMCTLRHPRIKTRFMEIFLGDRSRSQRFTRALRAEG